MLLIKIKEKTEYSLVVSDMIHILGGQYSYHLRLFVRCPISNLVDEALFEGHVFLLRNMHRTMARM